MSFLCYLPICAHLSPPLALHLINAYSLLPTPHLHPPLPTHPSSKPQNSLSPLPNPRTVLLPALSLLDHPLVTIPLILGPNTSTESSLPAPHTSTLLPSPSTILPSRLSSPPLFFSFLFSSLLSSLANSATSLSFILRFSQSGLLAIIAP